LERESERATKTNVVREGVTVVASVSTLIEKPLIFERANMVDFVLAKSEGAPEVA
jgi:hypothetical protein